MRNLSYSFKRDGSYFVFDLDTGKTIPTDRKLRNARQARRAWIMLRGK